MNRELERRAFEVFDAVCDLAPVKRAAALLEHCGEDAELRALVDRMLEQDGLDRGSGVLDESDEPGAGAQVLAAGLSGAPPERVGRYRIIREIGRGGMGVVYEAEQESPARHVALKVIRDAFASPQIHRRFRRESELLGRLQHPGIAHVYEAGVEVVRGRSIPFIAMEFIEGEPLTEHLATATSGRRGLLQLFIRICDGVQHAHQKGVIHRDLKPGNVLVTRASTRLSSVGDSGSQTTADSGGQPKIVDFGIARVSDPDSQATLQTHTGQLVGTLAYMSPEQIEGDPASIDTRCDVYAIGVMLYQTLSGRMPVDIAGKPVAEAARLIRESAPTPLGAIDASLRGDLETIVATAMEPDRERRYPSAAALGEDIRRHLASEPIAARPASVVYQIAKFASRNRVLAGGVLAGVGFLAVGAITASAGLLSALRANEALDIRNRELESVAAFQAAQLSGLDVEAMGQTLRASIIDDAAGDDPAAVDRVLGGVNFTSASLAMLDRHVFARAERVIEREFAGQALLRARLLHATARTMRQLGLPDSAAPLAARAATLRRETLGEDHLDTLASRSLAAKIQLDRGDTDAAQEIYNDVAARMERVAGGDHVRTWVARHDLAAVLIRRGRYGEAETALRTALAGLLRTAGEANEDATSAMLALGVALAEQGKNDEAIAQYERAAEIRRRVFGDDHRLTLAVLLSLGNRLDEIGRGAEAESVLTETVEAARRTLGDDHPDTLSAMQTLSGVLASLGRFDEAETLARESLERGRRALGALHPDTLSFSNSLGAMLDRQGRYEEAEAYYREAFEGFKVALGDNHPRTILTGGNLGYVINLQGRLEEAEPYYRQAYETLVELYGEGHAQTLTSMGNLASLLTKMGRLDEAEPLTIANYQSRTKVLGPSHPSTLNALYNVGHFLLKKGDVDAAAPYCEDALAAYEALGERHIGTLHSLGLVAQLRAAQGRNEEAEAMWTQALERRSEVLGEDHPLTQAAQESLVSTRRQREAP